MTLGNLIHDQKMLSLAATQWKITCVLVPVDFYGAVVCEYS